METAHQVERLEAAPGAGALVDEHADRVLARDGYVVLEGLAVDEVPWVRSLVTSDLGDRTGEPQPDDDAAWHRQVVPGETWRIGINELSVEQRASREVDVAALWERLIPAVFTDHRLLFTSFLNKHPGEDGALPLHQDPSVVDERRHRSYTLWIALDDMGPDLRNGELHVLPGSHEVGAEWRGTFTPATYLPDVARLWPHAQSLAVRAGDAIVLDARVVHGSPPNRGERSRAAVVAVVVPRGVGLVHAVATEDEQDEVAIVEVDDGFYQQESPASLHADPPRHLPVLEVLPRASQPTTADALIAALAGEPPPRRTVRERIRSWRGR